MGGLLRRFAWSITMTEPQPSFAGLAYMGAGFSFAAIVGVMALLGHLADGWLRTEPWLLVVGSMVGTAVATMELVRTVSALGRRKKDTNA